MAKDYYKILEVSRTADADSIKKSYRKLAMKYHPDRNGGDKEAEEIFRNISEAYETLSDDEKRKKYDNAERTASSRADGDKSGRTKPQNEKSGYRQEFNMNDFNRYFNDFFGTDRKKENNGDYSSIKDKQSENMFEGFFGSGIKNKKER